MADQEADWLQMYFQETKTGMWQRQIQQRHYSWVKIPSFVPSMEAILYCRYNSYKLSNNERFSASSPRGEHGSKNFRTGDHCSRLGASIRDTTCLQSPAWLDRRQFHYPDHRHSRRDRQLPKLAECRSDRSDCYRTELIGQRHAFGKRDRARSLTRMEHQRFGRTLPCGRGRKTSPIQLVPRFRLCLVHDRQRRSPTKGLAPMGWILVLAAPHG